MYNEKESKRKWYLANREREIARSRAYRSAHLEERKAYDVTRKRQRRDTELRSNYGITMEQWEQMFVAQSGRCAICEREFTKEKGSKGPNVDHNHSTGKVRQLLCYRCNSAIGFFSEDVGILARAIEYLNKWNKQ